MTNELLQQIGKAFGDVSRPTRVTKRVAQALDDEWVFSEERWKELYDRDHEILWTDLSDKDLEEYCFILPWLDDEGLLFYLPAFMCYSLRHFPEETHRAIFSTVDICSDFEKYRIFNPEQLVCVKLFADIYRGCGSFF